MRVFLDRRAHTHRHQRHQFFHRRKMKSTCKRCGVRSPWSSCRSRWCYLPMDIPTRNRYRLCASKIRQLHKLCTGYCLLVLIILKRHRYPAAGAWCFILAMIVSVDFWDGVKSYFWLVKCCSCTDSIVSFSNVFQDKDHLMLFAVRRMSGLRTYNPEPYHSTINPGAWSSET